MTVIAWDGKSLAVDRLGTTHGLAVEIKKYKRLANQEIAVCWGNHDQGLVLTKWYEDGCDTDKWPHFQKTDDWSGLIIAGKNGIRHYDQEPVSQIVEDKLQAWGSGRDYALGAMAMGADARIAVEVASCFNVYCGCGVDVFTFEENE